MATHANRVQMTVSGTPGTGTITLGSASSGYRSFASAYGADATVDVLIVDGTAWEVARGCTYTHSGTTLSRGTLESSSTGSAISLASSAIVSVIATADFGNRLERAMQAVMPGGRLTTESGEPVSTSDRTSQSTLYYTPYAHATIPLWDGARWVPTTFTESSLALSGLTSGKPYDVFGYLSSGALALELLVWTNDTTRATAVTVQDGRYCKSGDKTRLLLGTIYTTSATTTADAAATRYVSNVYNRTSRRLLDSSTTGHTYTTGSWREWNGGTGVTKCQFVACLPIDSLQCSLSVNLQRLGGAGTAGYANIDYDATAGTNRLLTNLESYLGGIGSVTLAGAAVVSNPVGKHYFTAVQYGESGTTFAGMTLYGDIEC